MALAIAQEHYDYRTDDAPVDPAVAAIAELLDQHRDFELTEANIATGTAGMTGQQWDEFSGHLRNFMYANQYGPSDFTKKLAVELAEFWEKLVRNQWRADAEQMHKDATEGYEQ